MREKPLTVVPRDKFALYESLGQQFLCASFFLVHNYTLLTFGHRHTNEIDKMLAVKKWQSFPLWDRDIVLIPVNAQYATQIVSIPGGATDGHGSFHWYLVVILHPGRLLKPEDASVPSAIE